MPRSESGAGAIGLVETRLVDQPDTGGAQISFSAEAISRA